jgi:hypothetical protein
MTRNITIKLQKLIPDFACLSKERQDAFVTKLENNPLLIQGLQRNASFYLDPTFNRAARCLNAYSEKQLRDILYNHPSYQDLKDEIYTVHIQKLGIDLEMLNNAEITTILQAPYTQLPFPKNWLKSFLEDMRPEMQSIQTKLLEAYQQEFGFLFKTLSLKFHFDIKLHIENRQLSTDEKNKYLLDMLHQDWEYNPFNLMNSIPPVAGYIQDWFKPWLYPLKKYMNEMLSAHVFYRLLGISSDHLILGSTFENPGLPVVNVFDYYNYHINRKSIHAAMSVWQALFKPLRPFFYEYVELAQSEENIIMICIRAFMPFIIMSMVLALGYAAILPLAYHLLIEYIFFIPALYFSIVVASQYIQLKNYLYLNIVEWFYGSVYATSNYEPSQNLIHGMRSLELAQEIADYYVLCLEQCDRVEQFYQQFPRPLNHHQSLNRKHNSELRTQLMDEWQDLKFSGIDPEHVYNIVESRLKDDKKNTKATIVQLYAVYFNLPEDQKPSFHTEYLSLKEKLETIDHLAQQLEYSSKYDEPLDASDRFHLNMV